MCFNFALADRRDGQVLKPLRLLMNQQWFWAAGSFVQWKRTLFLSEEVGGYASKVVLMFLVSQDLPPGTLRHH